jgi:hypothetical protein
MISRTELAASSRDGHLALRRVERSAHQGRAGGISLDPIKTTFSLQLDLPEAAALLSSLTVLGPTTSQSAASAMGKVRSPERGVRVLAGPDHSTYHK